MTLKETHGKTAKTPLNGASVLAEAHYKIILSARRSLDALISVFALLERRTGFLIFISTLPAWMEKLAISTSVGLSLLMFRMGLELDQIAR